MSRRFTIGQRNSLLAGSSYQNDNPWDDLCSRKWFSPSDSLFLLLALILHSQIGWTDIYSWKDAEGRSHYSDHQNERSVKLDITPGYAYQIVKTVYDGDTLLLNNGKKVRLLGINTPEIENSRKNAEPGGLRAKRWLAKQVQGKKVRLEMDADRKDRYRRTLAHIFTAQGRHINMELVERGLATVNIHPPNLKYVDRLLDAQARAEAKSLGIWREPAYVPLPVDHISNKTRRGWHRLIGIPVAIRRGRKFVRLIFSQHFDVRIAIKNKMLFPDLRTYLNKKLEVRGWISRRKENYSVLIRHPSGLIAKAD